MITHMAGLSCDLLQISLLSSINLGSKEAQKARWPYDITSECYTTVQGSNLAPLQATANSAIS